MEKITSEEILGKAAKIKLLILDVDGVLNDGSVYMMHEGEEIKKFSALDGIGIKMLRRSGVEIAVITGSVSRAIKHRMSALGVKYIFLGAERKIPVFEQLKTQLGLNYEQIAYVGDDVPDLHILHQVGLPITVANAMPLVKTAALWTTQNMGGNGAVREVCELIMEAQNTLQKQYDFYLLPHDAD